MDVAKCVSPVTFSPVNKVSAYSLERRIDFHLERIMKMQRLIYFKNSIQMLQIEDRINESLLEIISSSLNLIDRRIPLLEEARHLYGQLECSSADRNQAYHLLVSSLDSIKKYVSNLGQLIWALNSNKEHVKYVAKVFVLPDIYERPGPDNEQIELKRRMVSMIHRCEWAIEQSRLIRANYQRIIIQIVIRM